jgi:hypothetical protein
MVGRVLLVTVAISTGWIGVAWAQQSQPGAPVEITAKPPLVRPGSTVQLTGKTEHDGKRLQVSIVVTPPKSAGSRGGAATAVPVTLTAMAEVTTGTFTAEFKNTATVGKYDVKVTSPDGKGTGSTTFTVALAEEVAEAATKTIAEATALGTDAIAAAQKALATMPPSPPQQQLSQKLTELQGMLAKIQLPIAAMGKPAARIAKAVATRPGVAAVVDPALGEIAEWNTGANAKLDDAKKRLAAAKQEAALCDTINLAGEALSLVQLVTTLASGGVTTVAYKLFMNNGLPAALNALPTGDTEKFALGEEIKAGIETSKGLKAMLEQGVDFAANVAGFVTKEVFKRYCNTYEGPVTAHMELTITESAVPWWKYSVTLEGLMRLRFQKGAPTSKPIPLTGEIEGNATNFTFAEDVFVVEKPPQGIVVLKRVRVTPIPFVNSAKDPLGFGLFARMGTPGYFHVPVQGELVGGRIILKLLDAKVDFTDVVKNRLVLIAIHPALPIPMIKTFDFPVEKAHYVLTRGMQPKGESLPEFAITVSGDKSTIQREFTRDATSPDGSVKLKCRVVVKATSG